mmetsp:Transcript_10921/g.25855  ORF Transcript_10921/g.25855 Transcript_10921/m.25855 type:complete len:214 (-) Transcript_10921:195-836(-)
MSSPAFCAAWSCSSRALISLTCFFVTWLRRSRCAMVRAIKSTRLVGEKGGSIMREFCWLPSEPMPTSLASSRAARSCCSCCSSASMRLRTSVSSPNCLLTSVRRCFSRLRFRSDRARFLLPSSMSLLLLLPLLLLPLPLLLLLLPPIAGFEDPLCGTVAAPPCNTPEVAVDTAATAAAAAALTWSGLWTTMSSLKLSTHAKEAESEGWSIEAA